MGNFTKESIENNILRVEITYPENESLSVYLNGKNIYENLNKKYITFEELKELMKQACVNIPPNPPVLLHHKGRQSHIHKKYIDEKKLLSLIESSLTKNEE